MKKIMSAKKIDWEERHKSLQSGYGIEHPERIHGYAGLFFTVGDVYASNRVANRMESDDAFRAFVLDSVRRFSEDDYGDISFSDYLDNVESKWIAFGDDMFARYTFGSAVSRNGSQIAREALKIRYIKGCTYIMLDSELDSLISEMHEESLKHTGML